ncbi:MAG: hypothetical protein ACRDLQ_11500 [Solirubrobacterales bacterium]
MPAASRLATCFCLGALLGTLLDGIHVYGDVESYPDPALGRWGWFVPLEFGAAGALAGALLPHLERLAGPPRTPSWSVAARIAELCLLAGAYVSTVVLAGAPAVVTLALLALLSARLTLRPVRGDWVYALIAAIAGPFAEAALSVAGAFDYADPDLAGIPMWLPALWANGGLFIRRLLAPVVLDDYRSRSSTSPPSAPT